MKIDYKSLSKEELANLVERLQLENSELRECDDFAQRAFHGAPLACVKVKKDGEVVYANEFAVRFFGIPREEMIGMNVIQIAPEDQREKTLEKIEALTPENDTFYQYVHHVVAGKVINYMWCNVGVFEGRELQYMISYCFPHEVQEEIAGELKKLLDEEKDRYYSNHRILATVLQMLRESSTLSNYNILQLIREQYDADAVASFQFGEEMGDFKLKNLVVSNEAMLGRLDVEVKGLVFLCNEVYLESYRMGRIRVAYSGEEQLDNDFKFFLNKYHVAYKSLVVIPIILEEEFYGVFVILRERNCRRWTENDLGLLRLFSGLLALNIQRVGIQRKLEREQRLTMLAMHRSEVYPWEYDVKEDVYYNNQSLLERYGFPIGNQPVFNGQMFLELIHPDDFDKICRVFYAILDGSNTDGSTQVRVKIRKPEGEVYEWFEFRFLALKEIPSNKVYYVIGTGTCIEKYKQVENALLQAKEKAEESDRLKTAFLANMSHEIRTPLNAIVGFSELLMEKGDEAEREEYMSIIRNNNTLLLNLINDILDIARIESGRMGYFYSDTDINELFNELARSARVSVGSRPIEVELELGLERCSMKIERTHVTQVMMNFVNNAVKFTPRGTITLGYRLSNEGKDLYFFVRDTGCGIPADKLDTIFGRFVKLNDFAQGTGLGLSICDSIVKKMNGRIGVTSEVGKGSEFWFTLRYLPIGSRDGMFPAM